MEIKFTQEQMCQIIQQYFKEIYDITGKVNTKDYVSQIGFEMYPTYTTIVEMKIIGKMNLDGMKVPVEQKITQEDLNNAFIHVLSKKNIEVENVLLDKGITTKSTGYGLCERNVRTSYFRGVKVTTKNNIKKRGEM